MESVRVHFRVMDTNVAWMKLQNYKKIYLACPYSTRSSGHCKEWEQIRFLFANIAAMRLIRQGFIVFSPLSHSVPISRTQDNKYNTHELWLGQDEEWLKACDVVVVLMLPGHEHSFGVAQEVAWAEKYGKPVMYLNMQDIYNLEMGEEK